MPIMGAVGETNFMNTISKTLGIIGAALLLAVAPAQAISRIAVVPNVVTGGISTTGVVALNRKAPTGGESITLASNQSFVQVPASVTVAAGSRSASFTITTSAVSSKGGASITGTDPSGKSASGMVFVLPIRVIVLSLQPQKVEGGDPSTGTVTLSGAAPTGGELITLLSNEAFVQVPQSVTVAAGSNTATFTVTTSAVTSNGHALILATDPGDNHVGAGLQVTAPDRRQAGRIGSSYPPDHRRRECKRLGTAQCRSACGRHRHHALQQRDLRAGSGQRDSARRKQRGHLRHRDERRHREQQRDGHRDRSERQRANGDG